MKRFSWKKLMSLVVALALVVGVLHFGTRVSAEEQTPSAEAVGAIAKDEEGNEIDAIVYSMDREAVSEGVPNLINLVLIVDNSHSMVDNNRLNNALTAAQDFYNGLGQYVTKTIVELSATPSVVNDLERSTFDAARGGYGTPIGKAFDLAMESLKGEGINNPTIVIFTDGQANNENNTVARIKDANDKGVKIYSINYSTSSNVLNGLSYVTNVSANSFSATDLAAAFNAVLGYIRTDAVNARIVAKLGDFVRYTGNVEKVTYDEATNTITWAIPDNTTDELEDKLTTPNLSFQIVFPVTDEEGNVTLITDPTEVAKALVEYNKENPTDDQVKVDYDSETGKYAITVNVEAPNAVKLIYKIGDAPDAPEVVKDVNTQNTLKKVFFEGPLTTQWTVKYFVDGELKYTDDDIIREYGVEFDPTEDENYQVVEVSMLGENEGEYATDDYDDVISLSTQDPFTWIVVYTKKTSTVKFIDEFQALEDEGELPVTVQEETKAVGTQLVFPDDRPSYPVEGGRYDFDGWAIKHAKSAVAVDADGIEVETDVVEGYDLISANDYPAYTASDITFYAQYHFVADEIPEPVEYTVTFLNNDLSVIKTVEGDLGTPVTEPTGFSFAGTIPAYTTYTFAGWAEFDEAKTNYEVADKTVVTEVIPEFGKTYIAIYTSSYNPPKDPTPSPYIPPIIIVTPTPSPVPTEVPTEAPTPVPTQVPTEEPTPTPEPVVEVEEPETPEGDVEIDEIETPEGAPEEELDVEPIDTPQGDLPKTGVLPTYAFIGIGAACVLFGSILVIKRRKEEN